MLMTVIDGNGAPQTIIVHGQEALVDKSGSIAVTGVAQDVAVANSGRSGFRFQNVSNNPMYINDTGDATVAPGSFIVGAGQYWPPEGYAVTTNRISVLGTAGDQFTAKEW